MSTHAKKNANLYLSDVINSSIGESVFRCYQCGKCSAGCPVVDEMDFPPSQLLRMLQYQDPAMDDAVLRSYTIWLCLSCETCYTRCPQEVDIPKIMDTLRVEAVKQKKVNPRAKDIISFHKSFLDAIRLSGRLYEIGLVVDYKLRTRHFLQDLFVAPKMFLKGKLAIFPHMVKDRKNIRSIFSKTINKKADRGVC